MSFVSDQLLRLDTQLDRYHLSHLVFEAEKSPDNLHALDDLSDVHEDDPFPNAYNSHWRTPSAHGQNLLHIIRQLGQASQQQLPPERLDSLLQQANITRALEEPADTAGHRHDRDLEWLLLTRTTIHVYGIVLNTLVQQVLPLSHDLWYWDEVLSSKTYTALYAVQTSPHRVWQFSKDLLAGTYNLFAYMRRSPSSQDLRSASPLSDRPSTKTPWDIAKVFSDLLKKAIFEHPKLYRLNAISPFTLTRHEIQKNQDSIRQLREMQATALGLLIDEGLRFGIEDADGPEDWKKIVERAVLLMENVVCNVCTMNHTLESFEETVFRLDRPRSYPQETHEDPDEALIEEPFDENSTAVTAALSAQLRAILTAHIPAQSETVKTLISTHGRPSILTRYWLPATAVLFSSTTLLRTLTRRRAALHTWLAELGATATDFYLNWVLAPIKKILGTIRHSSDSEVALMSRRSLAADMDSLERMVLDFAADNPDPSDHSSSPEQLRAAVKEGDLTPVLRAYERDLRKPLRGAVSGELVRALLIQIQKTKVDVEVAISGIDQLLKSQELVFGFVGLTPGVLVTLGLARWLLTLAGRRGERGPKRTHERVQQTLRNIDRILTGSKGFREDNDLNYKEHGLLVCEIYVLRETLRKAASGRASRAEMKQDLKELEEVHVGVKRQRAVIKRMKLYLA